MNAQKYTQKSLEAVQNAQSIATEYGNQQIEQPHLLLALLDTANRELKELYLCGGGAGIAALRETIAETTRLEVHPATDLLPEQQCPEEEPWLYLRAIAGVFESFRGGKR